MKILVYTLAAAGPLNSLLGLCQPLKERGHEIYFILEPGFTGRAKKYGFNEILLQEAPNIDELQSQNPIKHFAKTLKESGQLSDLEPKAKLEATLNPASLDTFFSKILVDEPQVRKAVEEIRPDVILSENYFLLPSIGKAGVPWVNVYTLQPLGVYNSTLLPPMFSGYPTHDQTGWHEFDQVISQTRKIMEQSQNKLLEHFGYPPEKRETLAPYSPHLNIYAYPKELDYQDLVPVPPKTVQIDAFARYNPEAYELPVEFTEKVKPGDKVVYLSMGSMGAIDVDLMKRIVAALADTPHKYIVSKGPLAEEYTLPPNMWGEGYLPQASILPLVDLVITHGGNNTTTETICAGKPMIVLPLFMDQYDNAQRVEEKGFGVRLNPFRFEPEELRQAVDRVLKDEKIKLQVEEAAKRIEKDNSKLKACLAIEQLVETKL